MNDEQKEELLQMLESAANFMRGMQFDPQVGQEQKKALSSKADELYRIVEKYV